MCTDEWIAMHACPLCESTKRCTRLPPAARLQNDRAGIHAAEGFAPQPGDIVFKEEGEEGLERGPRDAHLFLHFPRRVELVALAYTDHAALDVLEVWGGWEVVVLPAVC